MLQGPSTSSYGSLLITAGQVLLGASEQIPDTATVTLNGSTASFSLNSKTETVAALTILSSAGSAAGFITGNSGHLIVNGALTMSGGSITFNSGTPGATIQASSVITTGGLWVFGSASGGSQQLLIGTGGLTIGNGETLNLDASTSTFDNQIQMTGNLFSTAAATSNTIIPAGANPGRITLNGNRVFDVADGAAANDLVISVPIADGSTPSSLTKANSGTLVLSSPNTYTGGTTINGGAVTVSGNGTLGAQNEPLVVSNPNTGAGSAVVVNLSTTTPTSVSSLSGAIATPTSGTNTATINNGGQLLTVNQSTASTFAGSIAGAGGLADTGTAPLTLSGNNTYTGGTTVSTGALIVNGSLSASSLVSVAADATLGGNGTVGTVSSSGVVSPGSTGTPGTLTTGSLSLGGGVLAIDITSPASYDSVNATGPVVDVTGATLVVSVDMSAAINLGDTFTVLHVPGTNPAVQSVIGSFNGGSTITVGSRQFSISYTGGDGNDVTLTALTGASASLVGTPALNGGSPYVNSPNFQNQHSMVESIVYSFSSAVSLTAGNFTLGAFPGGGTTFAPTVNVSGSAGNTVWTVTFSGDGVNSATHSIGDGEYRLELNVGSVSNTYDFFRLLGDLDGNGKTDFSDFQSFNTSFNRLTTDPLYVGAADFDFSHTVEFSDFQIFNTNFNKSLPLPLPAH
jgi:autotransporter-associated beta strand protein